MCPTPLDITRLSNQFQMRLQLYLYGGVVQLFNLLFNLLLVLFEDTYLPT